MPMNDLLHNYVPDANTWDEMFENNAVRSQYSDVMEFLQGLGTDELNKKEEQAKRLFMSQGITFTVYSSGEGIEKIFPFDIIPRIITAAEWTFIENGIKQRLQALNHELTLARDRAAGAESLSERCLQRTVHYKRRRSTCGNDLQLPAFFKGNVPLPRSL